MRTHAHSVKEIVLFVFNEKVVFMMSIFAYEDGLCV
jgi:hypothetical protein